MTIPEIAAQLRVALGNCVDAAKDVSLAERSYFTSAQNDSFRRRGHLLLVVGLLPRGLEEHQVPMFVAKQWAKRATNISEWMALLERNTAPPENN